MTENNTENTAEDKKKEFESSETKRVEPDGSDKKTRTYKKKKTDDKSKYNLLVSAIQFLNDNYEFRYNVVLTEYEYRKKNSPDLSFHFYDDRAYRAIYAELKLNYIDLPQIDFDTIIQGEISPDFNPFTHYLNGLDKWNPESDPDYIKDFLKLVALPDEDNRTWLHSAFKKWFASLVRSLWDDKSINHQCFILVGGQGVGKSTFLMKLVPEHLQYDYLYLGNFKVSDKDHQIKLIQCIMILLEELAAFNKTDLEEMKDVITRKHVKLRKAYGHNEIKGPRRASFAGSTNKKEVLRDLTGNRRYLVFEVQNIDLDKLRDFDINKIYSQGFFLSKPGNFEYWFDKAENHLISELNDEFREKSIIEELLLLHFRKPAQDELDRKDYDVLLPSEILAYLSERYTKLNINDSYKNIAGQVLAKYSFLKMSKKCHGTSLKGWIVKKNQTGSLMDEWEKSEDRLPI